MPFKQVGSVDSKYLTATDILIGDMSDINYEFLLFDRPIILLANEWLRENFPDIGIKTDLDGLEEAIKRSIADPGKYKERRKYWLEKTIYKPDGHSSKRALHTIVEHSKIENPNIILVHGNSAVRKTNLNALADEAMRRNFITNYVKSAGENTEQNANNIYIAAHFEDLNIHGGYKVHLDHGLKGKGTANVEFSMNDYKRHNYFPMIDLHITAGEVGQERTEMLLGPLKDRAVIAGYPKADDLLRLNTPDNRYVVCQELGFNENKPVITYAPAGEKSYMKPGGSLNKEVLKELRRLSEKTNYNFLVKLKYSKAPLERRILRKIRRTVLGVKDKKGYF